MPCVFSTKFVIFPFPRAFGVPISFPLQTNLTVTVSTAAFLLYTRSIGVAYFGLGACVCMITVKILKQLIKEGRPDPIIRKEKKKTYG